MSIFKRGKHYWFRFRWNGTEVRETTKQGNAEVARQLEAARRIELAKGEAGIQKRVTAPTLKEFAPRFRKAIEVRCAEKPRTISFYKEKLARLLEHDRMANCSLDALDEAVIEDYVQHRRRLVSPATVNRQLATLRRAMRLAQEWKVIARVPRIRLLPGERNREFVLSFEQEKVYLGAAPQPLHDVALLVLDTGLRVGEALNLQWPDVHLDPAPGAKFGYIRITDGKTRNAKRNISLTDRATDMLKARQADTKSLFVFVNRVNGPIAVTDLDHQHQKFRELLKMPDEFVIHSLRHTMLSRLGESGADAFTIMRIAGHSTVTVSQRYVHPSPESQERAIERMDAVRTGKGTDQNGKAGTKTGTHGKTQERPNPAKSLQ